MLALMASYDYRDVDEITVVAWLEMVGDLPYADARQAVISHYRESRERMMPADVRDRVKAIRAARLQETPLSGRPPADPHEYSEWLGRERKRIADGPAAVQSIEGPR